MPPKRSIPRRVFDYSIVVGGIALAAFILHSVHLEGPVFPLGLPEEQKASVGTFAAILNYALGSIATLGFLSMLGCGFYCVYTGEMELSPE